MHRYLAVCLVLALAACTRDRGEVKPDLPAHCPAGAAAELRIVERKIYVPVPASLTRREEIAEGPLAECPQVARDRRAALERYEARMKQIESLQGTEVKP